jgi:hypothetical protein
MEEEMNSKTSSRRLLYAFFAGFIAVLVFHQGMLTILHATGFTPRAPFPVGPTEPFHVPAVWSLAFWGGVWGLIFAMVDRFFARGAGYWISAIVFGALALSLVAWFVVAAIKGQPLAGGWKGSAIMIGLLVNGAWGIGTALLLNGFYRKN